MSRLRRRSAQALLLGRLAVSYVVLSVASRLLPLPRLARLSWSRPTRDRRNPGYEHRIISLALRISQLAGRLDRDCLPRSLLLYRNLSMAGADPELVIGMRSTEGALAGHAWVEVDGRVPLEERSGLEHFTRVLAFREAGRLVRDERAAR